MLDIENDFQKQSDNSTNSNSENDFKELDNEIGKVVRGEASFEEEKVNYNSDEDSNLYPKNLKNDSNSQKNEEKKNNLDKDIVKSKLINYLNHLQQENLLTLEQYKKNLFISLMNSEKAKNNNFNNNLNLINVPNNSNLNNYVNNVRQKNLRVNNNYCFYNSNINNLENNIHINNNMNQNMNNVYLSELISLYNERFKNCNNNINNQSNLNFININTCINKFNNCIDNTNINNFTIDNISLPILNNNNLFNIYNQREIQDNIIFNNKDNPNLYDNLYNNYINFNYDSLLSKNLQMKLLKNNLNKANQNSFILNQFHNNKNQLNANIKYNPNNQSQKDFNFYNINNSINNKDNKIKNENESFLKTNKNNISLSNINKNIQKYSSTYNLEDNNKCNNSLHRKKTINQKSDLDINKNIINLLEVFLCKDRRTTLMIKNIPNKYTISSFLEEINVNFKFTYDIFYLPIDYVNKCNLGFAFINFVEPFHIILFYELYRGKKWKKFNSDKICELLYAKYQGKKELIAHFEKGKVLSMESEEKRPLILPTPNPLPKINLPLYYLELFIKIYPNISYEIKEYKNYKNNNNGNKKNCSSLIPIFSIKGNFY